MKRKTALLLAVAFAVAALCCACKGKDPVNPDITISTTTVETTKETSVADKIITDLGIVMEVEETVVSNAVYSIEQGEIGQIKFTYNGNEFVFRGAKSLDYSDIHGITTPVDLSDAESVQIIPRDDGASYIRLRLTGGARIVEWSRFEDKDLSIKCTLYTPSALTDEELWNVIDTVIKSNK